MLKPKQPANEQKRLDALYSYNLLDTLSEPEYDQLTQLASFICDTPISHITLIDANRQWHKSSTGIEGKESSRDIAFCAHAILEPTQILEVEDASLDERFFDNPLVLGDPLIRFYAGVPLVDSAGFALGTICVIDHKPKKLTQQQLEGLLKLKDQVMNLIQLKTSQRKYRLVVENSSDLIFECDFEGNIRFANNAFVEKTGYSLSDLDHLTCWDLIIQDQRDRVIDRFTQLFKNRTKSDYLEFPIVSKSGEMIWIGQNVDLIYHKDKFERAYSIARDITQRITQEDELKLAQRRADKYRKGLRTLNLLSNLRGADIDDQLKEGLKIATKYLSLPLGVISEINGTQYTIKQAYEIDVEDSYSAGSEFLLDNTYCEITYRNNKPVAINHMGESEYAQHPCYRDYKLESYIGAPYLVDGERRGTICFSSPNKRSVDFSPYDLDFINLLAGWVGTVIEQDDRRKQILSEKNILRTFIESVPAAICMLDLSMNYIAASDRWIKEFDLPKEIYGHCHLTIFPEIKEGRDQIYSRVLAGEVMYCDEEYFEINGHGRWLKWEFRPWYTGKNQVGGMLMFTDDITTVKNQELELITAKNIAESSGQAKEQFLSTMSHEIRTPLNAIIGSINLLNLEQPDLAENERIKLLKFSSGNLLSLINNILDFNKMETGNLTIEKIDFDLFELLSNLVNTWKPTAMDRDIRLELAYADDLPKVIKGDPVRLSQIINNLLNNAVKFTAEGLVKLKVKLIDQQTDSYHVSFEVKDTGIGIPLDKQEQIFESFKQVSNEQTTKYGGTGLGLAISKRLVEAMDGHIQVISQPGFGSKFEFTIPLGHGSMEYISSTPAPNATGKLAMCVLLVEDNLANQSIAVSFLERWGIKVSVAQDGAQAVEKVKSKIFDLILMDIRMPVMDGYEASQVIRSMEDSYFKELPIIALTASTMSEVIDKIKHFGMNDFLSKPFEPEVLFQKLAKHAPQPIQMNEVVTTEQKKFNYLSMLFGDDQVVVDRIVKLSIKTVTEAVSSIHEGIESNNTQLIHEAMHLMKPNLHHLDLTHLYEQIPPMDTPDFSDQLISVIHTIVEEVEKLKKLYD